MKKRTIIIEILIWFAILIAVFGGIFFIHYKTAVKPNLYTIQFKDIDGITKGSPVRFMGINIGYVRRLTSVDKSVAVEIFVTKKGMKIPKGTTARVEFYGLGGSKSIELMPSYAKEADGIVTTDNIRVADIVKEAKGFVEIIEIIEKFVKSLDKKGLQNMLEAVEDTSPAKIQEFEAEMKKAEKDLTIKVDDIGKKQSAMANTINKANEMVLRINKFVKK